MLIGCSRCQAWFPAERGRALSRCPRCRAREPTEAARLVPFAPGEPACLALWERPAWLPRGLRHAPAVAAIGGSFYAALLSSFHQPWDWDLVGYWGGVAGLGELWQRLRWPTWLEAVPGCLTASRPLSPWPGRWIPSSAVAEVRLLPSATEPGTSALALGLRGAEPLQVQLIDSIDREHAEPFAARLRELLAAPGPTLPAPVSCVLGPRSADLRWHCGRPVRLDLQADVLRVQVGRQPALELDTDPVQAVKVVEQLRPGQLPRYALELELRRRGWLVLVEGEPFGDALWAAERELRRILRL
jgi:hypothetical protein